MSGDGALGDRIKRLRVEAGLTQQELAAPEYTHAYVSTIEAGRVHPSPAALDFFAGKLGVDAAELETGQPRDLGPRLELELQEAHVRAGQGQVDEATTVCKRVALQAKKFGLTRIEAKAQQGLAECAELRGDIDEAMELFEAAEQLLHDEPATARVDAVAGRARCLQMRGETRTAVYLLEQTLEMLEQERLLEPAALMRVHASLVAAYFDRGAYEKASASAREALALASNTSDPEQVGNMYVNVARVLLSEGKVEDAHDCLLKAEGLFRELDLQSAVADCHHARGYLLARHDELKTAREELEKARAMYHDVNARKNEVRVLTELARIERLEGNPKAAESLLETSLEILGERDTMERALALREVALCRAASDPEGAKEGLTSAAALFERLELYVEHAATSRMLGDLLRERGEDAAALDAYRRGILALEERL